MGSFEWKCLRCGSYLELAFLPDGRTKCPECGSIRMETVIRERRKMIRSYEKGKKVRLSSSFHSTEFDCHCDRPECNFTLISDLLVESLEILRVFVGPLLVISGYRCPEHNAEEGGAPGSRHPIGDAADVNSLLGLQGEEIAKKAEAVIAFRKGGIGYGVKGGSKPRLCHLDTRGSRARWTYP